LAWWPNPGRGALAGASRGKEREKDFLAWGSAQPIEKAQSRQGNPRQSKLFSLIFFARPWPDFAGFG
jgi:hypothetical protein